MYSSVTFQQPEFLDLDKEMQDTPTNSSREQQLIPNGDQGTFAQDIGMAPRYLSEFEFNVQHHEEHEHTVLEDPPALQHPQMFNEEQENYCFEDELYDDYTHEYRSMRTDVQKTSDVRIINNRGHVTQENNEYIPNGRQMTHNDLNVNLNQRYGHGQMITESRVLSRNHFNGVEEQYCSDDDSNAYGMPNGVQGFDHAYDYTQPNGILYQHHQGQLQSSREASMSSGNSFGSMHDNLPSPTYALRKTTRHRTKFDKWQIDALEERFEQSNCISKREMMVMVEELGLSSVDQVKFWFKNRKQKRTKELKEKNQADHQGHPGSVQSTQMLYHPSPNSFTMQTSTPNYHPYDNSFMAPSPIHNQMSSQCHPQNEDPMQPLRRVSKKIEDWQVKVLEHKFAGKYSSTKAQNEEAARELNLTIDQVKYFMRKKRLNRRDN